MTSGRHAEVVRKDMAEAQKVGITGTPAFVLAETNTKDAKKVTAVTLISGAKPFASFKTEIDQALAAPPTPPATATK
jgi:predicted DsbA family dithiol-disulfide isomerase